MADPTQGLPPPGVDPSDWIAAQRAAQMSEMLTGAAMTPEQPQQIGRVAARVSPFAIPAKMLEAVMAKRAFNKSAQLNAQNYATALQAFGAPSGQNGGSNPYNPQGLPAQAALRLYQSDPKAYAEYLRGPESVQLGRMAGLSGPQAAQAAFGKQVLPEAVQLGQYAGVTPQQAAGAALTKQSALEVRPGMTVLDPISKRTMIGADPAKGEYYAVGSDGSVHAFPIENSATIQAWRAGLEKAQQEANTPRMIPQGGGVEALGYPGTPPALRTTGTGAGQKSYFPSAPPAAQMPSAPPAAEKPSGIWANVPKLNIPHTPGQSTDTFHQQILKDSAAKHAELVNKYGSEADLADQKLQYNSESRKALASAETGPASEWLTENRAKLLEWGVPESLVPGSGKITPTMELNKNLKQSALQGARAIFGSRMTQMEVRLQHEELSPSTSMTKDAIESLMHQDDIKQMYAKQRSRDYGKYVEMGGDPLRFESWYASRNPLTKYAQHFDEDLAAEMRRRGLQ